MLRGIFFSAFLTSCLLSTVSYAMEGADSRTMQNIRIEKKAELDQFIKEYRETGKPISLAVACGSKEMPEKITQYFHSSVPAVENWVGLDLFLTDQNPWGGPHIRMDVNNTIHWQQVAHYLKENNVEVQTVALTIGFPAFSSSIFQESILPLVKKGGMVVYPECFRISEAGRFALNHRHSLHSIKYGKNFDTGLWNYYNPEGTCYQNTEALLQDTMGWIEKSRSSMGTNVGDVGSFDINPIDTEKKLEARAFVSRITSVKTEFLDNGKWLHSKQVDGKWIHNDISKKLKELGIEVEYYDPIPVFTKTEDEFSQDYFKFFKDYMDDLKLDISGYKIYSSQMPLLEGVEWYEYPKDGTLKLTYYGGLPSLVFTKK